MRQAFEVLILCGFISIIPLSAHAQNTKGAAQSGPATAVASDQEKVICKTESQTGSFIRKKKTCLTKREWAFSESEHKRQAQELQTQINTEQGN